MSTMSDDMSDEATAGLFGDFCLAGLWPGVGRAMVEKLRGAGITGPADVTASRLELVEGVGPKRAAKLAAAFTRARPAYETAELLIQCRVPARYAGSAVALLGPSAARQLRDDPWKLLLLPRIRPDQADWFARKLLDGQAQPQDPRRGRALVVHLLVKASRDGHTAAPGDAVSPRWARSASMIPAARSSPRSTTAPCCPSRRSGPGRAGTASAGDRARPRGVRGRGGDRRRRRGRHRYGRHRYGRRR